MSAFPGYHYHLDLVDSGSDEDTLLWMKHYASKETRERWMKDFPDFAMPPHEGPPFDRDRLLPQAPLPQPMEWVEEDDPHDEEGEEWKSGEMPF